MVIFIKIFIATLFFIVGGFISLYSITCGVPVKELALFMIGENLIIISGIYILLQLNKLIKWRS